MRSYVTIVDDMTDLLPYFVRYYTQRLHVSEFLVIVYGQRATMDYARDVIEEVGARFIAGPVFDAEVFISVHRDRVIRQIHGDGGWAYFTDMDEFPQLDVERELAHARERGIPYVGGRWIDRVAPQGRLVAIDSARPLEEQYPYGCLASRYCGFQDNVYVLSSRAPQTHHPPICAWGAKWWRQCRPVEVHHFRWQANLAARLQRRVQRVARFGAKRWANNIGRMQRYLEQHQGVDPSRLAHLGELIGC